MPKFDYIALDHSGQRIAGILSGPSEQAVLAELDSRRLTPLAVKELAEARSGGGGVSIRVLGQSYKQLADLLKAGVPLMRGLRLLAGRKSNPKLGAILTELADRVSGGEDLAKAMAERTDCFPPVHVAMVRAGERGGFLEQVLSRLGQMAAAQANLRSKVVASLAYPAVLVSLGGLIVAGVFAFFVPKFREVLRNAQTTPPTITKIVFGFSDLVTTYWPLLIVLIIGVIAGLMWVGRNAELRRRLDILRTKLPVLGPLAKSLAAARFCRMLGTMMDNGVPLLAGMQIARDAAGNVLMEEAIDRATDAVRSGQPLAPPLAASGMFDDDVVEMIAVAENANNLGDVLLTIADTTEERVDRLMGSAVKLIEPLLIVGLALIVGAVAAALVIPLTQLGKGPR